MVSIEVVVLEHCCEVKAFVYKMNKYQTVFIGRDYFGAVDKDIDGEIFYDYFIENFFGDMNFPYPKFKSMLNENKLKVDVKLKLNDETIKLGRFGCISPVAVD